MEVLAALFFVTVIWVLMGMLAIEVWEDMFDDIPNRYFRVGARLAMLALWPAWLVLCAVGIVIGIICMAVASLLE